MTINIDPTGLTPQQYLAKFQAAFQADQQYKVLGVFDTTLQTISQALPDDRFDSLKAARTSAAIIVKSKSTSTAPEDKKTSARAELSFVRTASYELDAAKGTTTAAKAANALNTTSLDFATTVNKYLAAANDSPDLAKDASFKASALQIYNRLKSLVTQLKPQLITEKQIYNASAVNAAKQLALVKAALDAFTPGTPTAVTASTDSDTVPVSDNGSNVDVTA